MTKGKWVIVASPRIWAEPQTESPRRAIRRAAQKSDEYGFLKNIGKQLSIDEVSLSNGELYTIVTNKKAKGRKGALVALGKGTKYEEIRDILQKIPLELRQIVEEVTLEINTACRPYCTHSAPPLF